MSKATIIAIVGKSGAGKTYASTFLQMKYGWQPIVSFTTRERREDEMDGREHFFVTKEEMPEHKRMVAFTQYGGHYYWTVKEQFNYAIMKGEVVTYIVDEYGMSELKVKMCNECRIIKVKIDRTGPDFIDKKRKARDKGMFHLPDSSYHFVLKNDGSELSFQCVLSDFAVAVKKMILADSVSRAWLVRQYNGELEMYHYKPQKDFTSVAWYADINADKNGVVDCVTLPSDTFLDVKNSDTEPTEVELVVVDNDSVMIRRVKHD